jgi:hypothetical protein
LLAALVAHGTNLGLATMAQSTKGITADVLHHVTDWYLYLDALKAANRALVHEAIHQAVFRHGPPRLRRVRLQPLGPDLLDDA